MEDSQKPYIVHSKTRITLTPMAKEIAQMHGMTLQEMAKHLLNQHRVEQAGQIQGPGED